MLLWQRAGCFWCIHRPAACHLPLPPELLRATCHDEPFELLCLPFPAGPLANSSTTYCRGSFCYIHNMVGLTLANAQAKCMSEGGTVWVPQSSTEAFAVESWFGLYSQRAGILIGVNRTSAASPWVQADGSTQSYTHW